MKSLIYIFLIPAFVFSCKGNNKQHAKSKKAISDVGSQALISQFKPIIQGVWTKSDYINEVIAKKSPLAAMDKATGMTLMYLDMTKISGDSSVVEVVWGNHEGGALTLNFTPGSNESSLKFGPGDLQYSLKNGDTTLTTYWPDETDNNKIVRTEYKRVLLSQGVNTGYGLDYAINKSLFNGDYNLIDTTGISSKVSFTSNGKVKWLLNYKSYLVESDLKFEPMANFDLIGFDVSTNKSSFYAYQFDSDTLKLYNTKPNKDSTLLILEKVKYKLVRVKE